MPFDSISSTHAQENSPGERPIPFIVTIDGPAASGKTTIGKNIADWLGYLFFDTGVMYRAVTWLALDKQVSIDEEAAITALAEESQIEIFPPSVQDGRACDILVENEDITWKIRRPEVDANVSQVSAYAGVRRALSEQQRRIGQRGRIVMVGRDIGTVVLPEADCKLYLDASAEERARRRHLEKIQRQEVSDYDEILAGVIARDAIDSTRAIAPLRPAEDAFILNSDRLSIDEVLALLKQHIQTIREQLA
ncbi:MAG: (d)CMP kinase [Anaerolineales bacterium]|jgi:cytidylate kinase|nr:(d)CMP kinase [Anaerolineales bacterium]